MHHWLPYWHAGLLGTSSARAFVERLGKDEKSLQAHLGDHAAWPESWQDRFASPDELRIFVEKRAATAQNKADAMSSAPRLVEVSKRFSSAVHAFRTPFAQYLGELETPESQRIRVAIVGTRKVSHESARQIRAWLSTWFAAAPVTVISGGAYGVDSIAHEAALDAGLGTWSVQAGGLGALSPAGNRPLFRRIVASGGAMISERPPHVAPRRHDFLARNRIIAALAHAVIVVRAPFRSGALNTAREARRMGIEIYAVPGSPGESSIEGSNALLSSGARVLASSQDWQAMVQRCEAAACQGLSLQLGERNAPTSSVGPFGPPTRAMAMAESPPANASRVKPASAAERALCSLLGDTAHHFDVLSREWRPDEHGALSEALLHAELRGAVARLPGNQYRWR